MFVAVLSAYAQPESKLIASNGDDGDKLGFCTALSGNYAIVGAPEDEPMGTTSGSVYFYELVSGVWTEMQNVYPSDGSEDDEFGYSVAMSGEWAAVGAHFYGSSATNTDGKVYIYHRDTNGNWSLFTTFQNTALDQFGTSVSMDGDYLAVGGINTTATVSGTLVTCGTVLVYRYDGSTWAKQAEIVPSDGGNYDEFGYSVAIRGSQLVVGAWKNDHSGVTEDGAAYAFSRVGTVWTEDAKITANDAEADDYFGASVAIHTDRIAIGSYKDDDNGSASGSAYIYDYSGGSCTLNTKVIAFDGESNDQFGVSIAFLTVDDIIVGAPRHLVGGSSTGAAYLYQYDSANSNWIDNPTTSSLTASDGASYDYFAQGVAGSSTDALCGAFREDDNGSSAGAAYFYDISASTLPVEFVSFEADFVNQQVNLFWETASETNNRGFEVQRSQDGINWEKIGWVDGAGNSSSMVAYEFTDKVPYLAINYYRLKQVDFDDQYEYSDIVSILVKIQNDLSIYPNPTSDYIHLSHSFEQENIRSIQLFDVFGRQVRVFSVTKNLLDVSDIPSGQYYLLLEINGEMVPKSVLIR